MLSAAGVGALDALLRTTSMPTMSPDVATPPNTIVLLRTTAAAPALFHGYEDP